MFASKTTAPADYNLKHSTTKNNSVATGASLPAVSPMGFPTHQNNVLQSKAAGQTAVNHQPAVMAKSLPAVSVLAVAGQTRQEPKQDTGAETVFSDKSVLQRAHFDQPPSKDIQRGGETVKGNVFLGTKCYAYSVFNALAQAGRIPELEGVSMTQEQVDTWIAENETGSAGGSVGRTAAKLDDTLKFMPVNRNKRQAVKKAFSEHFPVSIGVSISGQNSDPEKKPSDPANHWIYATGTTGESILGEDQQNTHRGILEFNLVGSDWKATWEVKLKDKTTTTYTYTITKLTIGYQGAEEKAKIQEFY